MENKRIDFLDQLKGIATLGVIMIHVNAQLISDITNNINYSKHAYGILITLSYLARYCVPVFILVTGYLLWRNNNTSLKSLFIKIVPVISMYILWSLIYIMPSVSHDITNNIINLFLSGKSAPHMYYIPTIYVPIVIIMTLIKKIKYSFNCLVINLIFWTCLSISGILNGTSLENLGFIMIYALIGASFNYVKINDSNKKILYFLMIIASILYLSNFIYITKLKDFYILQDHYNYFQISIAIYSILIFTIFFTNKINFKFLSFIGKYSLIVYFEHWMVYIFSYSVIQKTLINTNYIFYILLVFMYMLCISIPILIKMSLEGKYLNFL